MAERPVGLGRRAPAWARCYIRPAVITAVESDALSFGRLNDEPAHAGQALDPAERAVLRFVNRKVAEARHLRSQSDCGG